jgi:hypothetical protein
MSLGAGCSDSEGGLTLENMSGFSGEKRALTFFKKLKIHNLSPVIDSMSRENVRRRTPSSR